MSFSLYIFAQTDRFRSLTLARAATLFTVGKIERSSLFLTKVYVCERRRQPYRPNNLRQGNLGRNALRGFNSFQTDLSLRREFPITESFKVQFRVESFNIFNRSNFGSISNMLSAGVNQFGRAINTQNTQLGGLNSLYQVGGPRSFQFALKLMF